MVRRDDAAGPVARWGRPMRARAAGVLAWLFLGCGRVGFDAPPGLDGASSDAGTVDTSDGSSASPDAAPGSTCAVETLLTTYPSGGTGMSPGVYSAATLEFRTGGHALGEVVWVMSGASGPTDYRAADDPDFAAAASTLTDTQPDAVSYGHTYQPNGSGGYTGSNDAALVGATVTMVRRDIRLFELSPAQMSTATRMEHDIAWEVWGCR